jgi:hypothetical protein
VVAGRMSAIEEKESHLKARRVEIEFTPMKPFPVLILFVLGAAAAFVAPTYAADSELTLGKRGKLLLAETFDGETVPKGWNRNTGVLAITNGALAASELASDQHAGAFRRLMPLRDCAVQLDFKFTGATMFHLGFDPSPGELKKKGHLFSLIITPESWTLTEHLDKADPKSKNVVHAKVATKFPPDQWFSLLLEVKGNEVVARVAGREPLRATAKDFHVRKPGLVFRVGGKDGQGVLIDNVKVWELE